MKKLFLFSSLFFIIIFSSFVFGLSNDGGGSWTYYKDLDVGYRSETYVPDANTIIYYPFSDSNTIGTTYTPVDNVEGTSSYDGIVAGALSSNSVVGSGMYFDGVDDKIDLSTIPNIGTGDFTFSLWINPNYGSTDHFFKLGTTATNQAVGLWLDANPYTYTLNFGFHAGNELHYNIENELNEWHHIVVTSSGSDGILNMYFDGILVDSGSAGIYNLGTSFMHIGYADSSYFIESYMDEFIMTDDVWTPTEVYNYYTSTITQYSSYQVTDRVREIDLMDKTSDLVLYLPFDENEDDKSLYSYDITLGDSPTQTTGDGGYLGEAYSFDGTNDYMNLRNDFGNHMDEYTQMFWFKTSSVSGTNGDYLMGFRNGNDELLDIHFPSTTTMTIQTRSDSTHRLQVTFNHGFSDNTWYHVAYTNDWINNKIRVWINGEEVSTTYNFQETPAAINSNLGKDFYLGGYNNDGSLYLPTSCLLDEVKIYDKILSSSEIYEEYQKTQPLSDTPYFGTNYHNDLRITEDDEEINYQLIGGATASHSFDKYITDANTKLYMPFESSDPMNDESSNNDGTNDGSLNVANGYNDYGQSFTHVYNSETDAITWNSGVLDGETDFTISMWLKSKYIYQNTDNSHVIMCDLSTGNNAQFFVKPGGVTDEYKIGFYDGTSYTSTSLVTSGIWNHVVWTRSGSTLYYYINGLFAGSSSVGSTALPSTGWSLGRYTGLTNRFSYNGIIDELIVTDDSWTASEVYDYYIGSLYYTKLRFLEDTDTSETSNNYYFKDYLVYYDNSDATPIASYDALDRTSDANLVAQYHFDSDANDLTSNNNDGIVTGATLTNDCVFDFCYEFDGTDDYISLPTYGTISDDSTRCIWFKLNSYSNSDGMQIIDLRGEVNIWDFIQETGDVDEHKLAVSVSDGSTQRIHSSMEIPLEKWTHYCVVEDEGNAQYLYINGKLDGEINIGTIQSSSQNSRIGTAYGSNYDFDGKIDEVKLYSDVRTAEEIRNDYHLGIEKYYTIGTENSIQYESPIINESYAISQGILQSAIAESGTSYENKKVYLVDENNNQVTATVDKVITLGNQAWIFNYDNSTQYSLFNLTPAVYVLEMGYMENLTNSQISQKVASLINSTIE
jgi:hypothetical protein